MLSLSDEEMEIKNVFRFLIQLILYSLRQLRRNSTWVSYDFFCLKKENISFKFKSIWPSVLGFLTTLAGTSENPENRSRASPTTHSIQAWRNPSFLVIISKGMNHRDRPFFNTVFSQAARIVFEWIKLKAFFRKVWSLPNMRKRWPTWEQVSQAANKFLSCSST